MGKQYENELIQAAKNGDGQAYADLVAQYQARLFRMIYRFVGNQEDARDILQEVLLSAYLALPKFRGESSFYTWLYRIAIRTCFREIKSLPYKMRKSSESIDAPRHEELVEKARREFMSRQPLVRDTLDAEERIRQVRMAIASLSAPYFEVVVLRDIEGFRYEEIAESLGLSLGTVMSRLNRGRRKLLDKLKNMKRAA